jgi:RimJ/RimL family protein N-acetyltransferase
MRSIKAAAQMTDEGTKIMDQPTLTTARLVLRPFRLPDAATVQHLANEKAIADTTLSIPHPYAVDMAETWIAGHADALAQGRNVTYAITRRGDGALVGAMSIMSIAAGHQGELGYWIGVPFWGCGYCTEAGQAVLTYAFTDLGLKRIHAAHLTRNPASGRVMQKLGMQHEGTRRKHVRKWDVLEDVEIYGILIDEWRATCLT